MPIKVTPTSCSPERTKSADESFDDWLKLIKFLITTKVDRVHGQSWLYRYTEVNQVQHKVSCTSTQRRKTSTPTQIRNEAKFALVHKVADKGSQGRDGFLSESIKQVGNLTQSETRNLGRSGITIEAKQDYTSGLSIYIPRRNRRRGMIAARKRPVTY
ncbi:hypothetical protein HAX54_011279 [Datura stramonium]|uniref:Uncharacterized protein n=1 Tax=Datura stramonium TaxID=4076 RepID=A0ABS8TJG9_DATST|nr:hypothetical protein [Datura stramonium]